MDKEKACRILGIAETANPDEIKKKYRALIRMAHPDAKAFHKQDAPGVHSAQELNEAYAYLCEHPYEGKKIVSGQSTKSGTARHKTWKAKENTTAYRPRKIFYEYRDEDGEKIGEICVAEGKYYWISDEDFTMFLKSMFTLSKALLDEADEEMGASMETARRFAVQAELSYLLSAQFLDGEYSLKHLNHGLEEGSDGTYHFDAMLERNGEDVSGEMLYPKRVSRHKLYLRDEAGTEVGYLSFRDDRLYYAIIPLFEQRLVQVKIQLCPEEKRTGRKQTDESRYRKLDLWIRFREKDEKQLQESINTKIEKTLKKYKEYLMK